METKNKIQGLLKHLLNGLYEREEVMKLTLLSAIAGESIFLLGPPGVGKSLIARKLKHAFKDGKSFEYLMTKFSTPDEVFGPISIKKLKEEDKYERLTEKYMPGANIVFLDEIWKSSSSIQNALLTILNEKVYRNGEQEVKVDIKGIITASNELPPSAESFGPLYDRLLVRYNLEGIKENKNFIRMITDTGNVYETDIPDEFKISNKELEEWDVLINAVEVPEEVLSTIQLIRAKIEEFNQKPGSKTATIRTYDRRWKKIIRLVRTAAFLNDRPKADLMDCFLMVHCLWNEPNQLEIVQEVVGETIRKHGYSISIQLNSVKKEMDAFELEVDEEIKVKNVTAEKVLKPFEEEYFKLRKNGQPFGGEFIQVKDYNKLKADDMDVINIYDDQFKLINRLSAEKSDHEHQVKVKHNSVLHTFELETYQKEKINYLYKKPHPLIKEFWNKRYDQLNDYLNQQQKKLKTQTPKELQEVDFNLFIDSKLAPIVKSNLEEVVETLESLKLRLEKVRHQYENVN